AAGDHRRPQGEARAGSVGGASRGSHPGDRCGSRDGSPVDSGRPVGDDGRVMLLSLARRSPRLAAVPLLASVACAQPPVEPRTEAPDAIRIVPSGDDRTVLVGGELFTVFRAHDEPAQPILYPVLGPGGRAMMRHYPFERAPGEATDHPHHRSLWFAHGAVDGHDFWHSTKSGDVIAFDGFLAVEGPDAHRTSRVRSRWVAAGGAVVCTDVRTLRFSATPSGDARFIDYAIELRASAGAVVFGDTKEGGMAFRVAPTLRLRGEVATGSIVDSAGRTGGDVWGKRAAWVAYSGRIDDEVVGVAL